MIKLINEGFKKRYEQSLQESKMKDKTTNESLAESIKRVLSRLTEGPMSDEDKRETEILRNLYKRIGGKQLGKLSPEEKEVLNKYGIDAWGFRGDTKMITPGKKDVVKDTDLTIKDWRGRTVNTNNGDKINLADRARKIDNRTWGDKYVRPDWYQPRYGRQQAQQAERDDLADQMQKPLRDFKNARDEYKRAKKDVDNYYSDLGKSLEYVDKEYNDVVNDYDDLNWYKNNYKKSARKVQSILDKHRKKIESLIEQLNEATSPEDKADSNLLRNILAKREKRANAALTPQELAVLDKYGVNLSGKNIFKPNTGISMGSDSNWDEYKNPNYNIAGKFRKPENEYAKEMRSFRWYDNSLTFQDRERIADAGKMQKDVQDMRSALSDRKYYKNAMDSRQQEYDKKKQDATQYRADRIAQLTDPQRRQNVVNRLNKAKTNLDDIRHKYNIKPKEGLSEAVNTPKKYIKFYGEPKITSSILGTIIGQMSDGIWENSPGMEGYWQAADHDNLGNLIIDDSYYIYDTWHRDGIKNPYSRMSDNAIRRYYANKAKYIAQLYMHDHNINPYKNWVAGNPEECSYAHDDVTIGDMYKFYIDNK